MAGRLGRGEAWQFEAFAHELRLRVAGALTYLERFRVTPRDRALTAPWMAGDAGYFATTLVKHGRVDAGAAEALHRRFENLPAARLAGDAIESGLLVARLLASNGAAVGGLRQGTPRIADHATSSRPN